MLNDAQVDRYSRQIILPEVGGRGQEKLLSSTIAIVASGPPSLPRRGLGGGSSVLPLYLAAAGIGRLVIWTPASNSTIESVHDVSDLNPDCAVEVWAQPALPDSYETFINTTEPTAVIFMEESIELAARLNAACIQANVPLVWGRLGGAGAYLGVFDPRLHPGCRACAIPFNLEDNDDVPLRQVAAATLASQLAAEAIKLALGGASSLAGRFLRIDVEAATVTSVPFASASNCAVCNRGRLI